MKFLLVFMFSDTRNLFCMVLVLSLCLFLYLSSDVYRLCFLYVSSLIFKSLKISIAAVMFINFSLFLMCWGTCLCVFYYSSLLIYALFFFSWETLVTSSLCMKSAFCQVCCLTLLCSDFWTSSLHNHCYPNYLFFSGSHLSLRWPHKRNYIRNAPTEKHCSVTCCIVFLATDSGLSDICSLNALIKTSCIPGWRGLYTTCTEKNSKALSTQQFSYRWEATFICACEDTRLSDSSAT